MVRVPQLTAMYWVGALSLKYQRVNTVNFFWKINGFSGIGLVPSWPLKIANPVKKKPMNGVVGVFRTNSTVTKINPKEQLKTINQHHFMIYPTTNPNEKHQVHHVSNMYHKNLIPVLSRTTKTRTKYLQKTTPTFKNSKIIPKRSTSFLTFQNKHHEKQLHYSCSKKHRTKNYV